MGLCPIKTGRERSVGGEKRAVLILILMWYVTGPNFRHNYKCDWREVRACELNGALGGDPSSEVLRRGDLHLVVTEVVPVGGGADKKSSCAVQYLNEGLRL